MTIARPYQSDAVSTVDATHVRRRACIVVLPTGAGKTVVAALHILAVLARVPDATFLFLQHTEELIEQNMRTVAAITGLACTVVKGFEEDWTGRVVFASVPTLARKDRLKRIPSFTNMIVDECHHGAADGWTRVLDKAVSKNAKLRTLGLSATPERGDGKPLPKALGEIVFKVFIQDLIELGHLVPPRAYSVQLGDAAERIGRLSKASTGEGDQSKVAEILDTPAYNKAVVDQWQARAAGRQTIAFCSTIEHARHVAEAFREAGVRAAAIDYSDKEERRRVVAQFKAGEIDVLTNCLLLTEGFDHQPTGCVIVLRAMIHASTFMQAIGRMLRPVDAERFPGIIKHDAVCLDFAGAAERHRELDEKTTLNPNLVRIDDLEDRHAHAAPIPANDVDAEEEDDSLIPVLHEIDLARSQFRWTDLHGDGRTLLVSGMAGYATVFRAGDEWMGIGQEKDGPIHVLHYGARAHAFAAASDWIRTVENTDMIGRNRRWLDNLPTPKQTAALKRARMDPVRLANMSRYEASCHIVHNAVKRRVVDAARSHLAAVRSAQNAALAAREQARADAA